MAQPLRVIPEIPLGEITIFRLQRKVLLSVSLKLTDIVLGILGEAQARCEAVCPSVAERLFSNAGVAR
jgi:hypothetical protein